jgi:hypothetical protein
LVGQEFVSVVIKDLEHGVHEMLAEFPSRANGDGPGELVFGDGLIGECVHPHGDLEVIQVVEEQTEVFELLEG